MQITFDPVKREKTLMERGADFAEALLVFEGQTYNFIDNRFDYGKERFVTVGFLRGRMTIVIWTQRSESRHIISMRKANEREKRRYLSYFR